MNSAIEKIEYFDGIKVNCLKNYRDFCDEYVTEADIDFLFKHAISFQIMGFNYEIDRVKFINSYGDDFELLLANEKETFNNFKIPLKLLKEILTITLNEQKSGALKGWEFAEYIEYKIEIIKECESE